MQYRSFVLFTAACLLSARFVFAGDENQAPWVDAGCDQQLVLPTVAATLSGSISDDGFPYGATLSEWSQQSGPAGVAFEDSFSPSTTAYFPGPGRMSCA